MRKSFKFNKERTKSLDQQRFSKMIKTFKKKSNNKSAINNDLSLLKKNFTKETEKDEISILSNANLNIIKVLNECVNEDIYDNSSYLVKKDVNIKSYEKVMKSKSPIHKKILTINSMENKKYQSNMTNLTKISNKANLSIDIDNNNSISSIKKSIINPNLNMSTLNKNNKRNNTTIILNKSKGLDIDDDNIINNNLNDNIIKNNLNDNFNKKKIEKHYSNADKVSLKFKSLNDKKISINSRRRAKSILFSNENLSNKINNFKYNEFIFCDDSNEDLLNNNIHVNKNILGYLNEVEIMKINNNIHNDMNLIQLKKKISNLKKSYQKKYSIKNLGKLKSKDILEAASINDIDKNVKNEEKLNNKNNNQFYKSNKIKKDITKKKLYDNKDIFNRYRVLVRKKNLYDSIDDEEYKDEEIDYYISPNSLYIKIFDIALFFSSIFYIIFIPYFLSKNIFISKDIFPWNIILIFIDLLYIIDVIINCFRAYQNFDENLVKNNKLIFLHYIHTWFFIDFIEAVPYFSLLQFLENNEKSINPISYILLIIKIIKVYKMIENNSTIFFFSEILSKNEIIDDYGSIIISFSLTLCCLTMTTCLFIFLGINSYPSWITKLNIQDESYFTIFITALYFIIVTITTVGYGDISGFSLPEISFQILLLIIGTFAYSFIISYFSSYIVKLNKKSMAYEKKLDILQEIKLLHPNMTESLYNEILRNIYNEQLYEKKDKHLLFDFLPYSLKNKLIIEMFKPIIRNFVFFKNIDNADFIVKVITSLKPLLSLKGDVIIQEGDFIKEIIFVRKGIINLNISIDLDDPIDSIKKYYNKSEIENMDISYRNFSNLRRYKRVIINLDNAFDYAFPIKREKFRNNEEIGDNIEYIKIIEIRRNEHFGEALMFLNECCPLNAKIKSKTAELLMLRKMEAIEIYSIYPNIWRRINKKSLFNMEQISKKIKKVIFEISNKYNINIKKKNKSFKKIKNNSNIKKEKKAKKQKKEIIKNEDKKEEMKEEDNENINKELLQINMTFYNNSNLKKSKTTKSDFLSKRSFKKTTITLNDSQIKDTKNSKDKSLKYLKHCFNENFYISEDEKTKKGKENPNESNILSHSESKVKSKLNITSKSIYTVGDINEEFNEDENSNFNYNNNQTLYPIIPNISSTFNEDLNAPSHFKYLNTSFNSFMNEISIQGIQKNNKSIIYLSPFLNLYSSKENSIQINRSYDNLNKISNNIYIKDLNLQTKTKQFIIKECSSKQSLVTKKTFLHLPEHPNITPKINSNRSNKTKEQRLSDCHNIQTIKENIPIKRFKTRKSDNDKSIFNKINNINDNNNNIKNVNNNITNTDKLLKLKNQKQKSLSTNKLIELKDNKFFSSNNINNILDIKKVISPNLFKRKLHNKKNKNVKKKLNTITKNIEKTNEAINHPNEFYMNFFNNIIQQIGYKEQDDEINDKREKKYNKLKIYFENKINNNKDISLDQKINTSKKNISFDFK